MYVWFGNALAARARENKAKEMDLSLLEQGVSYEMIAIAAKSYGRNGLSLGERSKRASIIQNSRIFV